MADFLLYSDILSRIQALTQSGTVNFGQWDATRKEQLANQAQLKVHGILCDAFEELYFCEVSGNLTPVSNEINLGTLGKPFYARLAFQKNVGGIWSKVDVLTMADASVNAQRLKEVWYQLGMLLRSDSIQALTGTYRVIYNYRIPDMSKDVPASVCEIPREYADMVPLYAAAMANLQVGANDTYAARMGEFNQQVDALQNTARNRAKDRRRRVVDVLGLRKGRNYVLYGNQIV